LNSIGRLGGCSGCCRGRRWDCDDEGGFCAWQELPGGPWQSRVERWVLGACSMPPPPHCHSHSKHAPPATLFCLAGGAGGTGSISCVVSG
jgi:hypothetical protein